jgi:DNA mismatch repair protein MutS
VKIYLKESLDAIIPIKTLALESKQEAVKIIGDSLHSCELLRENKDNLEPRCACCCCKGNAIAKRGERGAR